MAIQSPIGDDADVYVGKAHSFPVTIYQDGSSSVEDITGWELTFLLKDKRTSAALISKTVGAGITLTTPASGLCTIALTASDTVGFADGVYYYDLSRTNSGSERVVAFGPFRLKRGNG